MNAFDTSYILTKRSTSVTKVRHRIRVGVIYVMLMLITAQK
jgi:hypothetical protein